MDGKLYFTLFVTTLSVALGLSLVAPLLPVYAQQLGAGGLGIGLIFASFSLARSIMLPVVGNLAEKWGRRFFILTGLVIFTVVTFLYDQAESVTALVFCRLSQGVAGAMVVPVARAYVGDMAPKGEEGRLMGHFNIAFFGGLTIGPWLGGFLNDWLGIRSAFYTMGVFAFFGLILAFIKVPKVKGESVRSDNTVSYIKLVRLTNLWTLFLFRFGVSVGVGMNWAFMPIFSNDVLCISSSLIGLLISLNVIMTTVFQPLFGRMADEVNRRYMASLGGGVASICLIMVPFCNTFTQLFIVNLIMGVAIGVYNPPMMAIAVDAGRNAGHMTKVMSLLEMSFSVGMVTGPLIAGIIKNTMGLNSLFMTGGLTGIAVSVVLAIRIKSKAINDA